MAVVSRPPRRTASVASAVGRTCPFTGALPRMEGTRSARCCSGGDPHFQRVVSTRFRCRTGEPDPARRQFQQRWHRPCRRRQKPGRERGRQMERAGGGWAGRRGRRNSLPERERRPAGAVRPGRPAGGAQASPRIFHNLRSSRQTELESQFPTHVVCAWIGNSLLVARKHDLQLTDEHFARAVQNPVQQLAERTRNMPQDKSHAHKKTPVLQGRAVGYDCSPKRPAGVDGNRTHPAPFRGPHRV